MRLQDIQATAPLLLVSREATTVHLSPGVTLPLGSSAPAMGISPAATGSVDPRLSVQAVTGSLWAAAGRLVVRTPLYAGLDDVRQGASGLAEVSGARRLGRGVVWVGTGAVQQLPGESDLSLSDVSVLAGGLWNIGETTSLTLRARVPVWTTGPQYGVAAGLEVRQVLGARPEPAH